MVCERTAPRNFATGGPQEGCTNDPFTGIALTCPSLTGRMLSRSVCALIEETCISQSGSAPGAAPFIGIPLPGTNAAVEATASCLRISRRFHCLPRLSRIPIHQQLLISWHFPSTYFAAETCLRIPGCLTQKPLIAPLFMNCQVPQPISQLVGNAGGRIILYCMQYAKLEPCPFSAWAYVYLFRYDHPRFLKRKAGGAEREFR
jgi:hypothetical protein